MDASIYQFSIYMRAKFPIIHPEKIIERNSRIHSIPKPAGLDLDSGHSMRAGLQDCRYILGVGVRDSEKEIRPGDAEKVKAHEKCR